MIRRIQEEHWKDRAGLGNLGALSDAKFDEWVISLFERLGYQLESARGRDSLGVDWILTDPRGNRTALQTRRWRQDVGPEAIEQIAGGAVFHRCDDRLVITTAAFTKEARRLGRQTETRLWGIRELAGAVEAGRSGARQVAPPDNSEPRRSSGPLPAAKDQDQSAGLVAAAKQPEVGSHCPRCGKPMVRRSVNGRPVMVCAEFPRCTGARVENSR